MSAGRDSNSKTKVRKEQRKKAALRKERRWMDVEMIRKAKRRKRAAMRAKNRGDIPKYAGWLATQFPPFHQRT